MSEETTPPPAETPPAEEKKPEAKKKEEGTPAENTKTEIEESKKLLKEIQEQNRQLVENLKKANEIMLAGKSWAGKEPTAEELEIAAARELIKGTGFEDRLFPQVKK